MAHGIVGIELNGSLELALSTRPVSVVKIHRVTQRNVRFSQCLIDFHSLERGGLRLGQHLIWRHVSTCLWPAQNSVGVCQTAVSQGEVRISIDRLLEIRQSLLQSFYVSCVPIKSPF